MGGGGRGSLRVLAAFVISSASGWCISLSDNDVERLFCVRLWDVNKPTHCY